jgi:hypothetical protein
VRGGTRKKIVAAVKSGKWLPSRSTTIHRPVDIDLVSLIFSFGLLIIIPTTTMNTVLYRTTTMNSALYHFTRRRVIKSNHQLNYDDIKFTSC